MKKYLQIGFLAGLLSLSLSSNALLVTGDLVNIYSGNDSETAVEANILTDLNLTATVSLLSRVNLPALAFEGLEISNSGTSGEWSYDGSGGNVDFFVVKAGPEYALYDYRSADMINMGLWNTNNLVNNQGNPRDVSHVTAYSLNGVNAVPVPAAVWLFGSALIGLAGFKRSKTKA